MNSICNIENWKLLTVSRGGTVSLVKGLTEDKAKELAEKLHCNYGLQDDVMYHCQDWDIVRAEAFK